MKRPNPPSTSSAPRGLGAPRAWMKRPNRPPTTSASAAMPTLTRARPMPRRRRCPATRRRQCHGAPKTRALTSPAPTPLQRLADDGAHEACEAFSSSSSPFSPALPAAQCAATMVDRALRGGNRRDRNATRARTTHIAPTPLARAIHLPYCNCNNVMLIFFDFICNKCLAPKQEGASKNARHQNQNQSAK